VSGGFEASEQRLGLALKFGVHVGEDAVEIECDAKRHASIVNVHDRSRGARVRT
jgi:hypothetical protein